VRRYGEAVPIAAFCVAIVGGLGAAVVYALGGQAQAEGVLLAMALGGIGVGLASWAKTLLPEEVVIEERPALGSGEAELTDIEDTFVERDPIHRRRFLGTLLAGALGSLLVALVFPIRSLGPNPDQGLRQTAWQGARLRLVRNDGTPVPADELNVNGVLTVWPEGHVGEEDSQTLLLHLQPGVLQPRPGREDWTVGDQVAFSKVCTHAGCPVGLFEERMNRLLCPCHQSTFDVADACRPVFGPATRSLPQLPLDTDGDGFLIATGDYSGPVGPGYWNQDR